MLGMSSILFLDITSATKDIVREAAYDEQKKCGNPMGIAGSYTLEPDDRSISIDGKKIYSEHIIEDSDMV